MPDEPVNTDAATPAGEAAPQTAEHAEAQDKLESGKSHFKKAAEDLRRAAEAKAKELKSVAETKGAELRAAAEAKAKEFRAVAENKAKEFRGQAEKAWGEASHRAQSLREEGETYVRKNPTGAVLGALAAGFVLGLLIRKH